MPDKKPEVRLSTVLDELLPEGRKVLKHFDSLDALSKFSPAVAKAVIADAAYRHVDADDQCKMAQYYLDVRMPPEKKTPAPEGDKAEAEDEG